MYVSQSVCVLNIFMSSVKVIECIGVSVSAIVHLYVPLSVDIHCVCTPQCVAKLPLNRLHQSFVCRRVKS